MLIKTSLSSDVSPYKLSLALSKPNVKLAIHLLDGTIVKDAKIEYFNFKQPDGQFILPSNISSFELQGEIDQSINIEQEQIFDPPIAVNNSLRDLLGEGEFLVKYMDVHTFETRVSIMNLHRNANRIGDCLCLILLTMFY